MIDRYSVKPGICDGDTLECFLSGRDCEGGQFFSAMETVNTWSWLEVCTYIRRKGILLVVMNLLLLQTKCVQAVDRYSVKPGFCNEGPRDCFLSGRHCDGHFTSAMEMVGTGGPGSGCPTQSTLLSLPVGACDLGSEFVCSPNPESCSVVGKTYQEPSSENSDECRIETAKFGSCGGTCHYSPEDCENGEEWIFPDPLMDCSCDQVPVGACTYDDHDMIFCAVNEQSCDGLGTFVPHQNVRQVTGSDCFLCRPQSSGVEESPTTTQNPSVSPMATGSPTTKEDNTSLNNDAPNEETNKSLVIIASAAGGTVVLLLIVIAFLLYQRKNQPPANVPSSGPSKKSMDVSTTPTFPATFVVDTSKSNSNNYEVDEDAISIL